METIHTGAAAITFHTTPEAFIAYQEQLAGRKLAEHEREVTAAWVEVFNLFYEDGLKQDHATLEEDLNKLDELMARHEDNAGVHKFAEACRAWMIETWRQGAERSISK
ncbi:hypothetical protein ACR742_12510 [Flavonifractor plautii]|uniref:hypothetical protein n=1 Tax=Flavonifractor plautii TaxID=292800 RepID=UPI003DA323C0|nr:hypothetical protein [Clostridiales bacterium]